MLAYAILNDLFYLSHFTEPSTPTPIDANVDTPNGDAATVAKPQVLLVAGATAAASILLLVLIALCIYIRRRKEANLDGL